MGHHIKITTKEEGKDWYADKIAWGGEPYLEFYQDGQLHVIPLIDIVTIGIDRVRFRFERKILIPIEGNKCMEVWPQDDIRPMYSAVYDSVPESLPNDIENLDLSIRAKHALRNLFERLDVPHDKRTAFKDNIQLVTQQSILDTKGAGMKTLSEIEYVFKEYGMRLQ